jgi:hypothetical protein
MTRHRIDPLRALTDEERGVLTQISRAASEPASHVARAKALLAVADGSNYQEAAHAAGRRAGDVVAQLVSRFNREGLEPIRKTGIITGMSETQTPKRTRARTPNNKTTHRLSHLGRIVGGTAAPLAGACEPPPLWGRAAACAGSPLCGCHLLRVAYRLSMAGPGSNRTGSAFDGPRSVSGVGPGGRVFEALESRRGAVR